MTFEDGPLKYQYTISRTHFRHGSKNKRWLKFENGTSTNMFSELVVSLLFTLDLEYCDIMSYTLSLLFLSVSKHRMIRIINLISEHSSSIFYCNVK